ncbi:MAG: hypothetical protein GC158_15105 [Cyanobacteria bacterium RI_101]|nr:hypothetical protein [Cyanobacteria bacterium RI_101]
MGKAIASVLALVADTTTVRPEGLTLGNPVKANLRKVANAAAANWLAYLRREDYSALGEGNIAEIITPVLAENPSAVLLAPEDWKNIFVWLNLKAQPGGGFSFPPELYEEVAQALTENFPKALLQVLKEDFAKDGKAYAALSLRLLTGLRTQLEVGNTSRIDPALKADILARVGELETGLRERVEATLREIATEIQSGFGEVCQRLGVVTTGIDQLLTGLGEIQDDLQDIKADVRTLLAQAQRETAPVAPAIPSNLPFSASSQFIGRREQLDELKARLQRENCLAICAVAGMGGVGKTELALQYALRFSADYPGGLCWLSCLGADLGIQLLSFGRNSLSLPIPEQGEMADQLAFCWNHWLAGNVLLIYDDVTDYSQLQPYLPPRNFHRFTALLTSRLQPNRASGIENLHSAGRCSIV